MRIGEVVRRLRDEFPDISISKIRFLEDEGLLSPQRTRGRLPPLRRARRRAPRDDPAAAARRVPAAARDPRRARRPGRGRAQAAAARRRWGSGSSAIDLEELCRRSGVAPELAEGARGLRPAGAGRERAADKRYPETDVDVAAVCAQLTRFGVDGRHLRTFRTATDREAALLEQLIAPALRSRNDERRAAGLSRPPVADRAGAGAGSAAPVARGAGDGGTMTHWCDLDAPRIREVDDFPTPGVGFKDITPLLADPVALRQTIADLSGVGGRQARRPGAGRGGARVHPGGRGRGRGGRRVRAGAAAGEAAAGDGRRDLPARVRRERARGASRT